MAGSLIAPIAGSVASGLISGSGSSKAERQYQQGANAAQQIITPEFFGTNGVFGSTNASGHFSANPFGQRIQNDIIRRTDRFGSMFDNFNRDSFRDRLLEASNRVNDKREGQAFASLESKLFNNQGASTGTQRQIADFGADLEDRRFNRALQAEFGADQRQQGLFNNFLQGFQGVRAFGQDVNQQKQLGLDGARALAPYAINNPAQAQAGAFRAQNTQDFFDGLGGTVGGALETGINAFQNRGGGSSGAGGFFNPSAINFGSNPFTSLGFG